MSHTEKRIIDQLGQLISTPSVSSTDPGWDQGNRAVIDLLASWLTDMGFATDIQAINSDGSKANLIASRGTGPGGLVLAGHTDTVPYDEGRWNSDPLGLSERNNRLYGLGSTDMKGFFPLAMAAAASFGDTPLQQPLIILATADEESSMNGARALAAAGQPKARAAIIGEPTSLMPVRMHKGIMMEAVHITGQAGHSSNPTLGNSALDGMHSVMGCIHGGDSPNRICGQSELHFDLRMTPGGDNTQVREDIRSRLSAIGQTRGLDIELRSLIQDVSPFEQAADSELVKLAEQLTGHSATAVAFATEAPFLQQLGMDTIVMGPGSIDQAHQPDEFMPLDQIEPCIRLLKSCIRHYCL